MFESVFLSEYDLRQPESKGSLHKLTQPDVASRLGEKVGTCVSNPFKSFRFFDTGWKLSNL